MKILKARSKTLKWLTGGVAALALTGTGMAYAASTARICFEAESAKSIESPLRRVTAASSSYGGKGIIDIPYDKNKTKGIGKAAYTINVPQAGNYYVWARTYWRHGCGNSIGVEANGTERKIGEDGTYNAWHWVGPTILPLKSGANTFYMKNTETGVRVDQFYLTTDKGYTPVGIRKATQ